ncbi:MAG: sulfatase-like hydrolase/transferase, partial [Bacteroidaceae bacterium]|nr:sulfatase-like hydrolase/transferase [Bacteroidaceae bacterium]
CQPNDSIVEAYQYQFCDDKTHAAEVGNYYHSVEAVHTQFAGMITRLDFYVGEVLAKLKEKGLDENTIVIFSSDNGPHEEGGADPTFFNRDGKLQGTKRSCHEGGIRIPFIVRWPGHVKEGSVSDHMLAFYDIMPTFMDLAGIGNKYPEDIKTSSTDVFDGISFAPTLLGQTGQVQHDALYWEFHETKQVGVRKGDWKLVMKNNTYFLYNLATDLHEDNNVAATYPDKVEELKAIIKREHTTPQVTFFNFNIPGI